MKGDRANIEEILNKELNKDKYLHRFVQATDPDKSASKPLTEQIIEDVTKTLLRPYTKAGRPDFRYKVNRPLKNLKQFQNRTRYGSVKKATGRIKRKTISKTIRTPIKAKPSTSRETGQGQEARPSHAADLARLKKYIQGRLPAEVRRNMGRPALQNITGRFSNSVQLLSLVQGKNTIMAKYTYLLRPYSTFENKGMKRWPMSYNPKPLIAKSIRNLAVGRIEQKLTVRRV